MSTWRRRVWDVSSYDSVVTFLEHRNCGYLSHASQRVGVHPVPRELMRIDTMQAMSTLKLQTTCSLKPCGTVAMPVAKDLKDL